MMRLSSLQKQVLLSCFEHGGRSTKRILDALHQSANTTASKKTAQSVVAKALENLIDKECVIGEGVRTPHKWYIRNVRLTAVGRRIARQLRGKQLIMRLR